MIIGVIALFVMVLLVTVVLYNSVVAKKNQVDNAFGAIDALLTKRHDLIPNLVAAVQNYMTHERGVLSDITAMIAKGLSSNVSPVEKAQLEGKISQALGTIMVAVENYPELKANQNFLQLQAALNEVEEQISAARRAYNASVTDYNNALEMFPTSIFAAMMGCQPRHVFEASSQERQNVDVGTLFKK